jgi:hypothetical protein
MNFGQSLRLVLSYKRAGLDYLDDLCLRLSQVKQMDLIKAKTVKMEG